MLGIRMNAQCRFQNRHLGGITPWPCASDACSRAFHMSFGGRWRFGQMLADELTFHKWYIFKLVILNSMQDSIYRRAKKTLMHVFQLILPVWYGVHIECRMGDRLSWLKLQIKRFDSRIAGWLGAWVDW